MYKFQPFALATLILTASAATGCAERLMKEGLGAALGAEGRVVPLHRAAPAIPSLQTPAPSEAHPELAAAAGQQAPTSAPLTAITETGAFAPVLLNYKGLKLGDVQASSDLPDADTLAQKLTDAWTKTLNDVQLKPDGAPLATLTGEVIHYEGLNILDAASSPFAQIIVRAKLTDAASGRTLATANLIGRSTAVASGTIDGLSGGVAKALSQWLAREGAVVTGLSGLRNAQALITNPTGALGSPTLPKVPAGQPAAATGATAGDAPAAAAPAAPGTEMPASPASATAAPTLPGATPAPVAGTPGAMAPMTPAGAPTSPRPSPPMMTPVSR